MPCSCFGKKDKKGGGVLGEEEKYRPRDSRERDTPGAPTPIPDVPATQAKTQQPLGGAPPPAPASTPGTPPSTPLATPTPEGDARLRPEDDPDKATRRRDVVASFYSDQCELIGFKATGSRPPSAHVGGSQDGGPAATSSPATSSPSSTRSGAFCRADLAEKRREFFRELAIDDDNGSRNGSRPTSRLTDPGSQQTPRHSSYQDQLHHTLPHLNKTSPRSNKVASSPFILHESLHRNSSTPTAATYSSEDTEPLLPLSSPQQQPKISSSSNKSDHALFEIQKIPSYETSHATHLSDDDMNDETPLLSERHIPSDKQTMLIDASFSPEISLKATDESSPENRQMFEVTEMRSPELLVDMQPTENSKFIIDTVPGKNPDLNVIFPTECTESSKYIIETSSLGSPELIFEKSPQENSKLMEPILQYSPVILEDMSPKNNVDGSVGPPSFHSPQPIVDVPNSESENLFVNMSVPKSPQKADHIAIEPQQDSRTPTFESPSVESSQAFDKHFDVEFSHEPSPQTLPVIINETLKQPLTEHTTFEMSPHNTHLFTFDSPEEQTPQTIVETTRQFISGSPDEQKTSQTIVETTRQFITGPQDEQTKQTIVETTQQYISGSPDEQKNKQTIVETTRQFISGIPDEGETQNFMEQAQQFLSGSPDEQTTQTIVKTTQVVSGSPDEQTTQTIVQTTQQFVSGSPDEQFKQTTVETTQQSLPPSVDPFFLTSAEEPDELPQKLLLQSASTVTHTLEKPLPMPRLQLTEVETLVEEEEKEEPKLPEVPCFGVPPPPSSPPPPLPEEQQSKEVPVIFPVAVVIPPGEGKVEEEPLPPAPPTPPSEQEVMPPQPTAALSQQHQQQLFETDPLPHTPPTPPTPHEDNEDLPPAPPTPPTPRVADVQLPSATPPKENELLPPTPPTPHREDELPSAPLTPAKEDKLLPSTPPTPPISSPPHLPPVTCGVEIVSSSTTLEDDGLGSEIDDALETLEGLSEEGNIARAAASS